MAGRNHASLGSGESTTMSEYASRLQAAMTSRGVTTSALAKDIGVSYQAVKRVLDGLSTAFTAANNAKAAAALAISPDWLATGLGEMDLARERPVGAIPYDDTKVRDVFVLGKGTGGLMPERIWTDGDYPEGMTDECAKLATADPHAFMVAVCGTSMVPRYNPDEYALVEPSTEPDLEDDVLVRLSTGQTMLKRLLSRRNGWRFGSYNSQEVLFYAPDEVTWVYYVAHPVPRRKIKMRC